VTYGLAGAFLSAMSCARAAHCVGGQPGGHAVSALEPDAVLHNKTVGPGLK
jgi:hypothetical protein